MSARAIFANLALLLVAVAASPHIGFVATLLGPSCN